MKKIIGGLSAAAASLILLTLPAGAEGQSDLQQGYTPDGCYYQENIHNDECGFLFIRSENCEFSCEWEECRQCYAEMGLKMPDMICAEDITSFYVEYNAEMCLTDSGYFGLHCKMRDMPSTDVRKDIYTVEAWADWHPSGNFITRAYVENAEYEYCFTTRYNEPTVEGPGESEQFWCIRLQNEAASHRDCNLGHRTVRMDEHLKTLLRVGAINAGEMPESAALYLDCFSSSSRGYLRVTSADYHISYRRTVTTAPVTTPVTTTTTAVTTASAVTVPKKTADADGCYFRSGFETGSDRWQTRGRAKLRQDQTNYVDGHSALLVTNRDAWTSGVSLSLKPYAVEPGKTYEVRVCVMQKAEEITDMIMYLDAPEDTSVHLRNMQAVCGQWTVLEQTFELPHYIPDGTENLWLYIVSESPDADFYVDAAGLWDEGCMPPLDLSAAVSDFTAETVRHTVSDDGLPLRSHQNDDYCFVHGGGGVKDLVGPFFRMGFCASPGDLEDPDMQAFYRKHFNSVSCRTELLPESTVMQTGEDGSVTVSLESAAPVLKYAEQNGLGFRGSALVNGSSMPEEMLSGTAEERNARLESMIRETFSQLAEEYPSLDLYAYDVCRNVLTHGSGLSVWESLSEAERTDYIIAAFRYARAYAPAGCRLFLSANIMSPQQAEKAAALTETIREAGDYIDGIALQGHLTGDDVPYIYEEIFWQLASLGLDLQITELRDSSTEGGLMDMQAHAMLSWALSFSETVTSVTFYAPVIGAGQGASWECCLFDDDLSPDMLFLSLPQKVRETIVYDAESFAAYVFDPDRNGWEISVRGDVNGSGGRDMEDVRLVLRYLAEDPAVSLSGQAIENADYDLDGLVTLSDAMGILQWLQVNPDLW